jgi:hypothetical protein
MATEPERDIVWMDVLDADACWRLLAEAPVGRVGFVTAGRPIVLPVNHVVDERTVIFRTAPTSPLGQLRPGQPVSFEVDVADPQRLVGQSAVVAGEVEAVPARRRRALAAGGPRPWAGGDREVWWCIRPMSVSGRAVSRHRRQPDGTFLPFLAPG